MRAIQSFIPCPRHTEVMRIFVATKPDEAWKTARHIDLSKIPWVRFLFDLRTIAEHFQKNPKQQHDRRLGVDQIAAERNAFQILYEQNQEIVLGAIGKFWHLHIPFIPIDKYMFKDFSRPGWGKVAWSITVEPYLNGSTICLELRTTATDDESWKQLNRYYHIVGIFSNLIRRTGMAKMEKELGEMQFPDDSSRRLPGDEILGGSNYVITDHINIEASPSIVWQYLMQMGCDRAGWYSVDVLDNGGIRSTDHLVEQWKDRKVGDRISATPKQDSFFEVWQMERERNFVIGGKQRTKHGIFKMTWAFVLEPIGADATRLIVRVKMIMSAKWKEWFMGNLVYPAVHGIMEFVQLKTIKRYAERTARQRELKEPILETSDDIFDSW